MMLLSILSILDSMCRERVRVSAAYCVFFVCYDFTYFRYTNYMLFNACVLSIVSRKCSDYRQESLVTHITASSHRVLNQLCFSMLSKTLSHTHDAGVRARACAPRRMSGCLSGCTGVGGCVSCYHDHTRGQRSKTAGPVEERNGERGWSDED